MAFDNLRTIKTVSPNKALIAGSFRPGVPNTDSTYTWSITTGDDVVVTSDTEGTAGDALDFQASDDGRTVDLEVATGDANFAVVVRFDQDDWVLNLVPGAAAAQGIQLHEDNTNKVLTIMYEHNVSEMGTGNDGNGNPNFEAAVGTTTHCAVLTSLGAAGNALDSSAHVLHQEAATPELWVEESGAPSKTHVHFVDAVTLSEDAVDAINDETTYVSGSKTMTASGGSANAIVSGDAVLKQDLANGVDEVAITDIKGIGFTPSQTAVGTYEIVLDELPPAPIMMLAHLSMDTLDDLVGRPVSYSQATGKMTVRTEKLTTGAATDIAAPAANDRLNFWIIPA